MIERLQKFLANSGVASRRKCEELILAGRVKVNGEIVTELGRKIDSDKDVVRFDDKEIKQQKNKVYILLNKPIGYVTTMKDQFNRDSVIDLVKINERVVPVGRLDMYTSGALILTNDGDFVEKVTHPRNEIEKTYNVTLAGKVTNEDVEKLRNGVEINIENDNAKYNNKYNEKYDDKNNEKYSGKYNEKHGDKNNEKHSEKYNDNNINKKLYKTGKAKVKILKIDDEKNISRLQITIHEGKNREIRKMCEAIGKKVIALHRAKIGNITVKDLPLGKWRYLKQSEVDNLIK
jgi:23S rRNA pseudouridine2605 synthase